jgi:invasion protein IalB
MAKSQFHSGVGARIAGVGAVAVTLMLGFSLALTVDTAHAQKKKAAAPAKAPQSAWVRLCDKGTLTAKDKNGKEEKKDLDICMTLHEQIDANSGRVLVSAGLQQVKMDGKQKDHFSVTVPLGMALPFGLGVTVFPKDLWAKVEKREKLEKAEEEKLKASSVKLNYSYCFAGGCSAELDAKPDFVNLLKDGAGFIVQAVRMPGTPVAQLVSLHGFKQALANPPTDTKKFKEARTELMKQIYERQKQLIAELKKQQESLNKMQPNVVPDKGTPKAKK